MTVVVPADAVEMEKLLPQVAAWKGPVYFRLSRAKTPVVFDSAHAPEMGKAVLVRDGDDVTIVSAGVLLSRCVAAVDQLGAKGIEARLINVHTVKPLDRGMLVAAAKETGAIVTVEEHSVIGGLGAAVAQMTAGCCPIPVECVGLHDAFAETGPYDDLLDRCGMAVADIVAAAERAIGRK